MSEPVLRIPQRKYSGETVVISARIPRDMLTDIDLAAAKSGRTRNELLQMSIEFALKHIEIELGGK